MQASFEIPREKNLIASLFDRRSALLLLFLSLPLLFLPKINLITFGSETAGIRIDDFLLMGFSLVFFWATFASNRAFSNIELVLFAIVGFSIFSCCMNYFLYLAGLIPVKASFFYSVRLFEYFIFFYVGALLTRFFSLEKVVGAFFLWNLLLMLMQKFQLIGIFSVEGYIAHSDDRMLGVASFGSEIGLLLNFFFCFFLYQEPPFSRFKKLFSYALLFLFIYLVVLSGARMAIFALIFSFLIYLWQEMNWKKPSTYLVPAIILIFAAFLLVASLYNASGIVTRSKGLLSFANIELISLVWDNIALDYDPIGKESVSLRNYDASWWMRIHKWCYALKIYWLHPESWLQGIGPGFAMAALDGGYLRIFTEIGVIGSILYGRLFYHISRLSKQMYWMMATFLLNMIFFDVYLAYKPMSLLFLIVGYTHTKKEQQ